MLKMEKNFRAHNDKGYPRQPYEHYNLDFWLYRLAQEFLELKEEIKRKNYEGIRDELADLSNLIDFAFERSFIDQSDQVQQFPQEEGEKQLFEHNKRLLEIVESSKNPSCSKEA